MKILQFPIADSFGGITHYVLDNWKWIDREKFQFDFATMSKKLDFADQILSSGSKIHYISCYAEDDSRQFAREIHRILDEGYDAVHLHTKQWKSLLVEKICLERKVPKIIVHSHSTQCDADDAHVRRKETERHEQMKKEFNSSLATDFWACSDAAADWLFGNQVPREKVRMMRNAIEVEKFSYHEKIRREVRQRLGVEGKFVLGNVGRMVYQKNHRFLLQVFSEVCRINENAILLLAGNGPLEHEKGKNSDITLRQMAEMTVKLAGTQVVFQKPGGEPEIAGYTTAVNALLDGTKMERLGWTAGTSLMEGMKKVFLIHGGKSRQQEEV